MEPGDGVYEDLGGLQELLCGADGDDPVIENAVERIQPGGSVCRDVAF